MIIVNDYTQALERVIQETIADPATFAGEQYFPSNPVDARTVRWVVEEGSGGLTLEHVIGTDPHLVQRPGRRVEEYRGGFYREVFNVDEDEILHLRSFASPDLSMRGLAEELERIGLKARRRIQTRMELLRWEAVFNGNWSYLGQTIDFQVPAGNRVTPTVVWSTAATATPLQDLRTWISETFRKYRIEEIVMNRKTANIMLSTDEVNTLLLAVGARQAELRNDPTALLSFFVPGSPPVRVYDGWYQTESVDGNGKITLSAPIVFIPDGLIYFHHRPMDDNLADIVMTPNLQNGSRDQLGGGIFVLIDDKTQDRPKNPNIEVVAGFNGGPRVFRPQDLLTADVL